MSAASRLLLLSASLLVMPGASVGAGILAVEPTLPSDTLEANFAPRSASGPTPELAPTLPSDTLEGDSAGGVGGDADAAGGDGAGGESRRRSGTFGVAELSALPHPERSEGPSRACPTPRRSRSLAVLGMR